MCECMYDVIDNVTIFVVFSSKTFNPIWAQNILTSCIIKDKSSQSKSYCVLVVSYVVVKSLKRRFGKVPQRINTYIRLCTNYSGEGKNLGLRTALCIIHPCCDDSSSHKKITIWLERNSSALTPVNTISTIIRWRLKIVYKKRHACTQ